ncbi:MAG: response regulator transcription factor [Bacteroidetes bacterium]|nr:response regulator transcription factor [Bacteroidota bacterium]
MKILVVDDEKPLADFLKKGLAEEGHLVEIATDGIDGYTKASKENFDLVILDWMMPGMEGIEVCQKLRAEQSDILIILLTVHTQDEYVIRGFNAGANDYIRKPFSIQELIVRINALSRLKNSSKPFKLSAGALELDLITKKVLREDKSIYLSNKEFALLEILVRNKTRVVSKAEILKAVWDIDFDPQSNIVEVFINALRKKIDESFPVKIIQTVRGIGYQIEEA